MEAAARRGKGAALCAHPLESVMLTVDERCHEVVEHTNSVDMTWRFDGVSVTARPPPLTARGGEGFKKRGACRQLLLPRRPVHWTGAKRRAAAHKHNAPPSLS